MKALTVSGPGQLDLREIPIPVPKDGEVLVKIKYAGICATDLSIYLGESSFVKNGSIRYPVRLGHEWSGIVEETGKDVTKFKPGDRVVGDNFVSCGECASCLAGQYNDCGNKRHVGTINCWDGCFADYMIMPERHMYTLSPNVPMDIGALLEPMSIAYAGLCKRKLNSGSTVVTIGTGPIGMSVVALAKMMGAGTVIMIGRKNSKLEVAKKIGADIIINSDEQDPVASVLNATGGIGADFILETSGAVSTIPLSLQIARQKATISLIGFYERAIPELLIDDLVSKEISMVGIMGEYGALDAVNKMLGNTALDLSPIITNRFPFSDCVEVFRKSHDISDRIKILFEM